MFYAGELSLLCDVFRKSHISADVVEQSEWQAASTHGPSDELVDRRFLFRETFPTLCPYTVYRLTDSFECCYRFVVLPDTTAPTVLCIGPYLAAPITTEHLPEIAEANGILPQRMASLSEFYAGLTVLSSDSHLFTMLHTFCERIWRTSSYAVKDIAKRYSPSDTPFSNSFLALAPDDTLVSMKAMERRYAFENEIIRAVSLGHIHMEKRLFSAVSANPFEKRLPDLLRNAKNYCIIMNTLLRKAAEQGGVHPLQLDRVSSDFAAQIENMPSLAENATMMSNMFRTYCRLVRDHSLKQFSSVVKQAILMIDSDLSSDLAPGRLAASIGVSLGHLCSVFKKETGKTLSEYIRERRVEYATYLLDTTDLQIQTVALHCGIMDVQYFSKLFKRQRGISPTEYRLARRRTSQTVT